ncbi:hypothetical protein E7744_08555 [Citricoccus sp. SGAir0253]|uniref:hypothetical protein n=1 Tax=Citricoccus sp. SGAir0253 TaxID=2567881 RepID=UPI0010CD0C68|nr:hypothetical protein [Citricoccus sp. SGAir0253]QCU78216.1 hypothetical protein E7744_08555 [Citricoccus sp. SGAir0253]
MPPPHDPGLLELRIHGVRNTPPHRMLQTTPSRVVSTRGDALAGFSTARGSTAGHRVEAYAWGRLARFTGLPALGRVGDAAVRAAWFSLAPFGLVNTAYWSRHQLGTGPTSAPAGAGVPGGPGDGEETDTVHDVIGRGRSAGTVRVLGLALTLLFVTTATTIALDMAAASRGGWVRDLLAQWPAGARTALLAGLPVLAVTALAVLSTVSRTRYLPGPRDRGPRDREPDAGRPDGDATPAPAAAGPAGPPPALARRGLWRVGAGMRRLGVLHGAAALAWTGTVLGLGRVPWVLAAGWPAEPLARSWVVVVVLGAVVTAAVGIRILRPQVHDPRSRTPVLHWVLLAAGAGVLVAGVACSLLDGRLPDRAGSTVLPGSPPGPPTGTPAAPVEGGGGGLAVVGVTVALVLLLGVLLVQGAGAVPRERRDAVAWRGQGPFVFAALACGFALVLSFSAVIVAGWVLGDTAPPVLYVVFAAGFTLLALAALLALGVQFVLAWRAGGEGAAAELAAVRERLVTDAGAWDEAPVVSTAARAVWASRRRASLFRRAEVTAGWAAAAVLAGLVASAVLGGAWLAGWPVLEQAWPVLRAAGQAGLWAAVALVVTTAVLSARDQGRPVGLLWDLMCFLPTQAHPYGPPCYSERVVPEVVDRIEDWLRPEGAGRRRVLLSGHSMGLVLALCVLFHLSARGMPAARFRRLGLVSYGTQVRRYFGRFFPEVLGAPVLSTVPAPPPSAAGRDPWPPLLAGEVRREADAGWTPAPGSPGPVPGHLWELLGERWTNLYRPNDPLGFTVRYGAAWPADGMDVQAEEFVRGAYQFTVATHDAYLESAAYARAVRDVAGRL